ESCLARGEEGLPEQRSAEALQRGEGVSEPALEAEEVRARFPLESGSRAGATARARLEHRGEAGQRSRKRKSRRRGNRAVRREGPLGLSAEEQRISFKTRCLALIVILSNVLGNTALSLGMKQRAGFTL